MHLFDNWAFATISAAQPPVRSLSGWFSGKGEVGKLAG
jgi:hypothetical protein